MPAHRRDQPRGDRATSEAAKAAGGRALRFASSASMYGAATGSDEVDEKRPAASLNRVCTFEGRLEEALRKLADDSFSPILMRNATAYGASPRLRTDLVVNNLLAWAFTTGEIRILSDGTPWRPLVHVQDIAASVAAVLTAPREVVHARAFNICPPGENYQVRDLAEIGAQAALPFVQHRPRRHRRAHARSYRVSFEEFARTFPGFRYSWTAADGVAELARGIRPPRSLPRGVHRQSLRAAGDAPTTPQHACGGRPAALDHRVGSGGAGVTPAVAGRPGGRHGGGRLPGLPPRARPPRGRRRGGRDSSPDLLARAARGSDKQRRAPRARPGNAGPAALGPVDVASISLPAASTPSSTPARNLRANVTMTFRALDLARESGASRLSARGRATSMGRTASCARTGCLLRFPSTARPRHPRPLVAHAYGRRYGLPVVVLRPFTVYGPARAPTPARRRTIRALVEGRRPRVTSGRQSRDFVFVDDVADAFLCAATSAEATGETINVCSGTETSVREVVELAVGLSGSGLEPEYGAEPIRDTEVWSLSGDPQKARRILSWEAATPLREGLLRTLAAYRDEPAKAAAS